MIAMGMVQVPIDEVVHVVAVGHRGVTAVRTMDMPRNMATAAVLGGALCRVGAVDVKPMLLDTLAIRMMKMAVVKIVHVIVVLDGLVPAVGTVLVRVVGTAH
jgi:hypothetical protein